MRGKNAICIMLHADPSDPPKTSLSVAPKRTPSSTRPLIESQSRLYYAIVMDRDYTDKFLRTVRSAVSTNIAAAETSSDPSSLLQVAFDAIIQGDFDAFGRSVTDDVELSVSGFGALDGMWRGRDAVVAATRKNFALLSDQKPEIESMIWERDRAAVLLKESGTLKSSGQTYTVRGVQWFTFADGKISKIDEIVANIGKVDPDSGS